MENLKNKLISLHLSKFTGRVKITKDQVKKIIFFRNGTPTYVESNIRSEALGQMMLHLGKLTQAQYDQVLDLMEKTSRRQGEIIVELGYLSGFEVFEALKTQVVIKFQNCFLMGDCEVVSEEGIQFFENLPEFPFNFLRAYLDVAVEAEAYEFTEEEVKNAPQLLESGKLYIAENPLQAVETKWIRRMDGRSTIDQIFNEFIGNEREISALIQVLANLKILEIKGALPQRFQKKVTDIKPATTPDPPAVEKPKQTAVPTQSPKGEVKKGPSELYSVALDLDQPYHKILKIPLESQKTQIKIAYDAIVRKLQLDSIDTAYLSLDEKIIANQIFDRITLAYTVLSDSKKKEEYKLKLSQHKEREVPSPKVIAEVHCQKGKFFIAKRKYEEAEREIRKSIELDPQESAYLVELSSLIMVKSSSKKELIPEEAEKYLKQALKLNSSNPEAFFQLGIYYKQKNDLAKARAAFSKMHEAKPNDPRASSELRLLNKKIEEKGHESPFLKLFKKKEGVPEDKKGKKKPSEDTEEE